MRCHMKFWNFIKSCRYRILSLDLWLGARTDFFRSLRKGLSRAVFSYSNGKRAASRTVPENENVIDFPAFDSSKARKESDLLTLTLSSYGVEEQERLKDWNPAEG